MNNDNDSLRYPIGKFSPKESYSSEEINDNISRIESLPGKVESVFKSLSGVQLETPYREGGWKGRQVLHHLADSHMNAYIRIKWTLTEETPVIKAYDEKRWAETPEIVHDPDLSVQLLKSLHKKFVVLLRGISPDQFKKAFIHPDSGKQVTIGRMTSLYAWHGDHHLGHLNIIAAKPK